MQMTLPSWRLALNFLSGKRGRTALILAAISMSASLVVAVSCAISTVQASMELGLVRVLGSADARIIHQFNGRFSAKLLEQVHQWPEVKHVTARLGTTLSVTNADGRVSRRPGEPAYWTINAIGVDFETEPHFTAMTLIAGRLPTEPNEILIDALVVEDRQADIGDVLLVERAGGERRLKVVGVYERPRLIAALQQPTLRMSRATLAEAAHHQGEVSGMMVILHERENVEAFCEKYQSQLPPMLALEPAEMVRSGFDQRIVTSRFGVVIASVLTFMSAAFIAVTAMTTSVIERQREMAMVRSIGAGRGQLFASQLFVGVILGALGAAIGIPFGLALASSLTWWFSEALPSGLRVHSGGIGLAALGAMIAGLLGALYPAWLASTVTPMQAMARRARPVRMLPIAVCTALGLCLVAVQLVLLLPDDVDTRFYGYAYVGLPIVHVGYFLLAVPLVMLVAKLLGRPMAIMLGLPSGSRDMLTNSILATPFRNGFTAGALMVGISVLVSTWAGGHALLHDWLGQIKFADGFAYRRTGISAEHQQAIANLPFVKEVCPIGYLPVRVVDRQVFGVRGLSPANVTCIGFDPDVFFAINAVTFIEGEPKHAIARLKDGDAIIVAERFLTARNVGLGDRLTLGAGGLRGPQHEFEIVGVVGAGGLDIVTQVFGVRSAYMEYSVSSVFMDMAAVKKHFDNDDALMMQINLAGEISDAQAGAAIAAVAPGVRFRSGRWIMEMINNVARTLLTVQSSIAFAALILACIGVGNVIAANVYARRFEYGVLRAVGGKRSLLLRLIFGEAALLAIGGAVTGTILGMHLGWVGTTFYRDLAGIDVTIAFPTIPTTIGWAVLLVMALAAATPAALSLMRGQPSALLAGGRHG